MGNFVKCKQCGSSNRSRDALCYNCRGDLHAAPTQPSATDQEIAQLGRMENRGAFYAKCAVFLLALLVCRPYFTRSQVYGLFEYAILPFHEAGHYFLMPFAPHTLMVAGGSIVQICMPFGFAIYFVIKRKEYFSACVPTLWLFGNACAIMARPRKARSIGARWARPGGRLTLGPYGFCSQVHSM